MRVVGVELGSALVRVEGIGGLIVARLVLVCVSFCIARKGIISCLPTFPDHTTLPKY